MYNNLIEEDIMILDNEFFKIDTMFETVDKMYDIKQRELEYNYIYTESINEEYVDLYTEAEEAKSKNEQGLLGRLFTAILNFIRKIRAKILRFFGNDNKANELEAKIKGNPKLANQTVEITNTTDAEKAIDEGTSFFGSLIDKIVKGTATEADADAAEEKNKSLLNRIAIFGGGALLAAGGAKVASDKLKERGVTKQTIKENVSNLLKREKDTEKKSNEVTQTNEQNVQKAQQAMNNNSQNGNEENTKAGRRIVSSFKDFITDAGKFFTGKASELKSKINGAFSNDDNGKSENEQQTSEKTNKNTKKITDVDSYYKTKIEYKDQEEFFKLKDENNKIIKEIRDKDNHYSKELWKEVTQYMMEYESEFNGTPITKKLPSMTLKKIKSYNKKLKEYKDKVNEDYNKTTQSKTNTTEPSKTQKNEQDKPEETQSKTKPENKVEKQPETSTTDTAEQKNGKNDKTKPNDEAEQDNQNNKQQTLRQEENEPQPKKNDKKKDSTKDEQQTSTSQAQPNGVSSNNSDDDKKKRTPEPNSYCDERIKDIKFYLDRGYKLTEEEQKQINEIKDRLKNKKCTENDVKILGKISAKKPPEVEMDEEIEKLMFKFHDYVYSHERPIVLGLIKRRIENGCSIVSMEDFYKINFPTDYKIKKSHSIVERAKIFLDSYKIYSKYKNPDKNKVKEALKNLYGDDYIDDLLDEEMNNIKTTFNSLDKYDKELNELIKKRETFKESSYDLINDILTIFENSF